MTSLYRFISLSIWGNLPGRIQRSMSKAYANVYNKSFTKYIIKPYCKFNNLNEAYLSQFKSASGKEEYSSFQDFFTRVYKEKPVIDHDYIWPCEGLLCDYGRISDLDDINIKGDTRSIRTIFGKFGEELDNRDYFSNVFLHNNNYHRIHSPVEATILDYEIIPGELVLLRPWIYPDTPSLPALRNERVNIKMIDKQGKYWYLSIVGGPAVGTIELARQVKNKTHVNIGDEVGKFLLGSTLCMVSPIASQHSKGQNVFFTLPYSH